MGCQHYNHDNIQMKKSLLSGLLVALIAMSGCKKDENSETSAAVDKKLIISELFNAGMAWNAGEKSLNITSPINIQVENYAYGVDGGYIHVLGSITGNMTLDDQTYAVLGGTMLLGLTETINDYTMSSNGQIYTLNGAPYVSLAGTFTLLPGGSTFGTASSMEIGGGFRLTGPDVDETVNIQITIIINSNGTGGHVSGTYANEPVDYSF